MQLHTLTTPHSTPDVSSTLSQLELASPPELVAWALNRFAGLRIAFTTAFGLEGCALIDMIARTGRPMRVLYIDTGFFFPETHALRERLMRRYPHLTFVNVGTTISPQEQERLHGPRLWERDPDACCRLRKVEPMRRVLSQHDVWITGIRKDQTSARAMARIVEWDFRFDVLKFNPLVNWTRADVVEYIRDRNVPYNILHERGYPSIGCTHCTRPVEGAGIQSDTRAGRWNGLTKTECGLHANSVTQIAREVTPADPPPPPLAPADPPSAVEEIKRTSGSLRGSIAQTLASDAPNFSEADYQILKFHGIYQQDDRDDRNQRRKAGLEKAWMFMVRAAIPGGALTAQQWLAMDAIAERLSNGTLRLTTRQGVQFHGVGKGNLKSLIGDINRAMLTTLAACGDIRRNVMATAAPIADEAHRTVQRVADDIARALAPASGAYHEIWVDGEQVHSTETETVDPFYGETYLPRKFKVGVAMPGDASLDVYSQDCGLVAVVREGHVIGFNVLVGGGLGMTHKKADTFARLASTIGFVRPEHVVDAVRVVAAIFRDHGNRSDRRHARLKYLVESWGLPKFRDEFIHRFEHPLLPPVEITTVDFSDGLGRHAQGDGRYFYGVFVENGRVADNGVPLRSALRDIASRIGAPIRLTPAQNILFHDLSDEQVRQIESILRAHGVPTVDTLSRARRHSLACPALPTCGLALADAERALPDLIDDIELELTALNLEDAELTIRMTGCPNGCARPYTADIGLVGRKPGVYNVMVGGGLRGDRVADLFADDVPADQIVPTLRPLLQRYAAERFEGEGLGDFYQRVMCRDTPRTIITGNEQPTREQFVQLRINA